MPTTFSINQVTHLYVCNDAMKSTAAEVAAGVVKDFAFVPYGDYVRLHYKNAYGEVVPGDLMEKKHIKCGTSSNIKRSLTKYTVSPVAPIIGKEYILRLTFFEWGTPSQESQYYKFASHKATTTSIPDLLAGLKQSLDLATSTDPVPYIKTTISGNTLIIEEVEQPWTLGLKPTDPLNFVVQPVAISTSADTDVLWATVAKGVTPIASNGKVIAELEHFCVGFRGDIYRGMGYPHVQQTKYLVNPDANYATIDITFSFHGSGMDSGNASDKRICLAIPFDGTAGSVTKVNAIITALNTKLGTSIKPFTAPAS